MNNERLNEIRKWLLSFSYNEEIIKLNKEITASTKDVARAMLQLLDEEQYGG